MPQHIFRTEPIKDICGEPQAVWCEIERPSDRNPGGVIEEGFYIVANGDVYLADANGKAISVGSPARLNPLGVARDLLRTRALNEKRGGLPPRRLPAVTEGRWRMPRRRS
jgi:hypothetical protein